MTDPTAPGCPTCGTTVNVYDHRPGYRLEIDSPYGRALLLGTAEEIYADPRSRMADMLAKPTFHAPSTKVALQSCGHELEDAEATGFLTAAGDFALNEKRRAAEKVLDTDREVLDAATAAGHGELVDRYRQAVYAGNREVAGLRVALVTLADGRT